MTEHPGTPTGPLSQAATTEGQARGAARHPVGLDILVVDDDRDFRAILREALTDSGHVVAVAGDGAEAIRRLGAALYDVVLCDVRIPRVDGLSLFRQVRKGAPDTEVILMTGYATVDDAVAALKEGAYDYLTKPFDLEALRVRLNHLGERRALRRQLAEARERLRRTEGPGHELLGATPAVLRLLDRIDTMAQSDASVLITGESGTGKELVARALHERSPRAARPFVTINCAAIPEPLIEAELFGHARGAFTGAVRKRDGRFKAADGGTLLLDEVAELPPATQAKLLRVLQEGLLEPLGTNDSLRVDVRVISATHRNLRDRIAEGLFREDLYFRLKVLDLEIPPLRERRADLPLLLHHFLVRFAPKRGEPPSIAPDAWAALSRYPFPGNVRELAHAVQRAVVMARGGEIKLEDLPSEIAGEAAALVGGEGGGGMRTLAAAMKEFEREYLARALAASGGKRMRAAEQLGISRKNLWEKLRMHGLDSEEEE